MARKGRGSKKAKTLRTVGGIGPTPERLAKGDLSEMINPALIDSNEQPIGLTRRFKSSHLDRLYRNGRLTWAQWYAGDTYRTKHQLAAFGGAMISGYGERTSGDEPAYGLPRTEAQLRARGWLRKLGLSGRSAYRDTWTDCSSTMSCRYGGRAAMRAVDQVCAALDALAGWMRIGG